MNQPPEPPPSPPQWGPPPQGWPPGPPPHWPPQPPRESTGGTLAKAFGIGCGVLALLLVGLTVLGLMVGPQPSQRRQPAAEVQNLHEPVVPGVPVANPPSKAKAQERTAPPPAPPPAVTMANFNRLRMGMSYAQVTAIIGEPSQEMSRVEVAGTETVMYMWEADGITFGGNMNAMFQNGRLVSKAQFGLR
jgi:hypothetical protein